MSALSVALDLGSTRIKAARLSADGTLSSAVSVAAPPLGGAGELREGDASAYLQAAESALARAREGLSDDVPLGIASQRSSFLLWDAETGRPATPLVSWQDRRAAAWCARHRDAAAWIAERTGLVLSPHYAGPKLATMRGADADLTRAMDDGRLLFGTLDAWLVWNWSGSRVHRTDATMAARTQLFDVETGDWSAELLRFFGVPAAVLPRVEPTVGRPASLGAHGVLSASVADQAAGLHAAAGEDERTALVNFGTGAFVLRPTRDARFRPRGYLLGPVLARADAPVLRALEGTINGGAAGLRGAAPSESPLTEMDPDPHAFCVPDHSGVGAPHWRADIPFTLSEAAAALPPEGRRRVVLEGLLFRVAEILRDLFPGEPPARVILAGGLANERFLPAGLAALLGRPVSVLGEPEATLLGAARLAAGLHHAADSTLRTVPPGPWGAYLREKLPRWTEWVRTVLEARGHPERR